MFTDPQSVTVAGSAKSLPRTSTGSNQSEYTTADGLYKLKVSSSYGKRNRRVVRLEANKVALTPLSVASTVRTL